MEASSIYQSRIKTYTENLRAIRKEDWLYTVARVLIVLAMLVLLYLGINSRSWSFIGGSAALLPLFLFLLLRHRDVRHRAQKLKSYIRINRAELGYLEGDLRAFNDGSSFLDPAHLYARDIQLLGPGSLFQRINRTATHVGKQLLAGALLQQASEGISAKQEAVQDLQDDLDFRQSFGVEASPLSEDPGISQKLKAWQNTKNENSPQPKSWLLYPLSALALGTLIYWGIYPSLKTFYVFSAAAFLNLTVGGLYFKNLKKDYQHLEGISKSLLMYSQMLSLIENRKHSSLLLQDIEAGLEHPGGLSSRALRKLSKILDGFDQLHNVVGALVMNALFMYHLHIWRKLRKWQCSYQTSIEDWLQVVGAFDHYCSLANYAFNHSSFSFPQISSQSEYVAHNMGHPFIRDSERVTNQCDFTGFKYVILTGSNMAGKSTYLKSLGVNLVLAKAGAPVCAGSMRCFPFQLLTSMNPEDSIQEGVSYFQAEVLRLKQIRQKLDEEKQCLVLLDEILRGTNSDDKRKGTRLFMQSLSKYNALGVIATHDVDIATLAEDQPQIFNARFFESQFIDGQLSFDYKLRQGVCATPNATELMRAHGII